jgi:hypothetical protein
VLLSLVLLLQLVLLLLMLLSEVLCYDQTFLLHIYCLQALRCFCCIDHSQLCAAVLATSSSSRRSSSSC